MQEIKKCLDVYSKNSNVASNNELQIMIRNFARRDISYYAKANGEKAGLTSFSKMSTSNVTSICAAQCEGER